MNLFWLDLEYRTLTQQHPRRITCGRWTNVIKSNDAPALPPPYAPPTFILLCLVWSLYSSNFNFAQIYWIFFLYIHECLFARTHARRHTHTLTIKARSRTPTTYGYNKKRFTHSTNKSICCVFLVYLLVSFFFYLVHKTTLWEHTLCVKNCICVCVYLLNQILYSRWWSKLLH